MSVVFRPVFDLTVREANNKSSAMSKVDPMLKPSDYKATTQIMHVFRAKTQIMSTPFSRDRS